MIVKVTRGKAMLGAVAYLAADKEGVVRENPRVIAGLGREGQALDAETVRATARDLDGPRRLFGTEVLHQGEAGHVWACSLALKREADGILSDQEWRAIAEGFAERMGFTGGDQAPCRWVAVRHGVNAGGHDHVHLVVGLVREDGRAWDDRRDWVRASKAANALEREHGLSVVEGRELGVGARGHNAAEVAIAKRLDKPEPAREYLERVVRACAVEARDERDYVRLVRAHGVTVRPRMAKGSTEVAGLSYSVNGSASYGGGRLARDLTLPRLRERWQSPTAETADQAAHDVAGKLAAWSIRSERTPGPIARESRELGRYAQTRASSGGLVLTAAVAAALRERIRAANREMELEREAHEREQHRRREPRIGPGFGIDF